MRYTTSGCIIHSTRGGAPTYEQEYEGTKNWFSQTQSQVSAHDIIAWDGTICYVVDDTLQAWHAGTANTQWLGIEMVQPNLNDPISDDQLQTLVWRLLYLSGKYNFALDAAHLPFHSETSQGQSIGKSDCYPRGSAEGAEFRRRFEAMLDRFQA